jgi:class 3 adenylate cyclase/tetratricopeptide (TPR) repeat protein
MSRRANRFCTQCGAPLGAEPRFCGTCGAPVAATAEPAAPAPAGERRQVTTLFADLAGYTRLSTTLDPEETHALLQRFFATVDGLIAAYGGTVDKHIGDGVMGVFGAPVAHGNDPERAIRAAIEIHAAVAGLGQELGHALGVHIGVASGEVVAAGIGSDAKQDYTVTGDSVNLAARLEDMAETGQTLISDAVHDAVAEIAETSPAGEVTVRGIARPVRVWRVDRLRAEKARPATALTGRRAELRQFEGALDSLLESRTGQVVYVRGEAGIGKTRLVEEFAAIAQRRGLACHRGLVLDFGAGKGRDATRTLLRSTLGLGEDDDAATRAAAASARQVHAHHLPALLDLLDLPLAPEQRTIRDAMDNAARHRARQAVFVQTVEAASRLQPLLITVEDLHWADRDLMSDLAALAARASEAPIILLMTSRVEGDPIDQAWRSTARGTSIQIIDLGPLPAREARALAAGIIDPDSRLAEACVARAEGNPLFLLQLLRNATDLDLDAIPDTLQSVVQSRLDRLPPADKRALQAASVIGQRFGADLLGDLIGDPAYRCDTLIANYLVRPDGDEFLFVHALVRDGVYASLLRQTRRALHRQAASWFEQRDPALCAQHLDRGEDDRAPAAYARAAQVEAWHYRFDEAVTFAARGIELARSARDRFDLSLQRAEALRALGRTQESIDGYRDMLGFAATDADRGRAWIGVAAGLRILSRIDEAMHALAEADRALAATDLMLEKGNIHFTRGNLHFARGEPGPCGAEHEKALAIARQAGDAQLEANALGGLGDAAYASGRMRTALENFRRCSALCRARGFGRIDVSVRFMIGHCLRYQNEIEAALQEHEQGVLASTQVGNRLAEMTSHESAGMLLVEFGRYAEAIAALEKALQLSRQIGSRRYDSPILVHLGGALCELGRPKEGRAAIDEALAVARETGMGFMGPLVLGYKALYADDPAESTAALAEGASILAQGCIGHNYFWFYRDAIEHSLKHGRWDEALRYAQALDDYTAAERLPWSDLVIARARALVAFGRGKRSPALKAELQRVHKEAVRARLAPLLPRLEAALAED